VLGAAPLVTREVVKRMGFASLDGVLKRDSGNLLLLRGALALSRVVSRAIDQGMGPER
jgi:hypothetical protein